MRQRKGSTQYTLRSHRHLRNRPTSHYSLVSPNIATRPRPFCVDGGFLKMQLCCERLFSDPIPVRVPQIDTNLNLWAVKQREKCQDDQSCSLISLGQSRTKWHVRTVTSEPNCYLPTGPTGNRIIKRSLSRKREFSLATDDKRSAHRKQPGLCSLKYVSVTPRGHKLKCGTTRCFRTRGKERKNLLVRLTLTMIKVT